MSIPFVQIDAFTDTAFSGNPAVAMILDTMKEDGWLQNAAREMNVSDTAYLVKRNGEYDLRWFTPEAEVDLCGHATLASAHYLWSEKLEDTNSEIIFHSKSGILKAKYINGWIELNFPSEVDSQTEIDETLINALGQKPVYVGKNRMDYIVQLENEDQVKNIKPDLNLLKTINSRGFIVTAQSQSNDYDFISRFFAPNIGINEDPVTGSAHCCLEPFWAKRLNKNEMTGYQASSRGGIVKVRGDNNRTFLLGKAVTILKGIILH